MKRFFLNQKISDFRSNDNLENTQEFWALKDISLNVQKGEVIGIIGRNGAGKTTLLKILSRITEPTEGEIRVRGRVASLLEVGTGFHPELSGRENILMNGAILGMTKVEIKRKFDEIVSFAEIKKFIDTPVKRYSSGMYVRLAFAVAAHLEPEILLVDEVLAVGDTSFQKKCLGKMSDVARGGRTVLFVSHNMAAISSLCPRTILLKDGNIVMDAATEKTVECYLNLLSEISKIPLSVRNDRDGSGLVRFIDVWIENESGQKVKNVYSGQNIAIVAVYESKSKEPLRNFHVAFALKGNTDEPITDLQNESSRYHWGTVAPSRGKVVCKLPNLALNTGKYRFNICCRVNGIIADIMQDIEELYVEAGDFFGTGKLPGRAWGPFLLKQEWTLVD